MFFMTQPLFILILSRHEMTFGGKKKSYKVVYRHISYSNNNKHNFLV